ncbi:MAG: hypothetical protein KC414_13935, partial [Romboutsia sp.]|nr:hypothetical protein [Romboutsia sp.]
HYVIYVCLIKMIYKYFSLLTVIIHLNKLNTNYIMEFDIGGALKPYEGDNKIIVMSYGIDNVELALPNYQIFDRTSIPSCIIDDDDMSEIIDKVLKQHSVSMLKPIDRQKLLESFGYIFSKLNENCLCVYLHGSYWCYNFISEKNRDYVYDAIYKKIYACLDDIESKHQKILTCVKDLEPNPIHSKYNMSNI